MKIWKFEKNWKFKKEIGKNLENWQKFGKQFGNLDKIWKFGKIWN